MTVSHLVRRGAEAISTLKNGDVPEMKIEIGSPWLAGLLFVTIIAFAVTAFSVEYTYGLLVPTLAAVEESNPDLYLRVENDPANKTPGDPIDLEAEAETTAPKPVTSKLRTTIRHLRSRAGRWSRFRGLSMFIAYGFAQSFLAGLVPVSSDAIVLRFIIQIATAVVLANLQVAWVHIVISEPSPKRFYQRIPSFRSLTKILPAAAFEHLLINGAYFVVLLIIKLSHGLGDLDLVGNIGTGSPEAYRSAFGLLSIATLVSWLASFPARVIFIRVAASMLPEEDESIVPFDRSFGGKVVPGIVGGGVLSIKDAWTTFDRDGWKRYIKALVKATGIQFALAMFFSMAITAEIFGGALVVKGENKN
ncbi:hypothetical protein BJY04DRAFT_191084 [Aspergillus karnatakaensis]|uniref:uncharacterized protein n=1 Tax=Aspergillus karnatakaensis TaxID=1810916 RepID=UPI003CCC97E0